MIKLHAVNSFSAASTVIRFSGENEAACMRHCADILVMRSFEVFIEYDEALVPYEEYTELVLGDLSDE